jgi:hypothetical protein
MTAMSNPTTTYTTAICQLKTLANKMTDAKSTKGDEIKKEKVTPKGNPARVNPIKMGIDEQLQNGVTVPSKAPIKFAQIPLNLDKVARVRSGVILACKYDEIKIKIDRSKNILITS